jgi:hypothetical protein
MEHTPYMTSAEVIALRELARSVAATFAGIGCKLYLGQARTGQTRSGPWYAWVEYPNGLEVSVHNQLTPEDAADALAFKLILGAKCACGRQAVGLPGSDPATTCLWTRLEGRWHSGCEQARHSSQPLRPKGSDDRLTPRRGGSRNRSRPRPIATG